MPKRSYPFDASCPHQLKTHVGPKELSEGVMGKQYKQEIFDRTKKLLFNGAKSVLSNAEHQNGKEPDFCAATELLTGQTIIGQDGKLHRNPHATKVGPGTSKACSFCVRSVGDKGACSQCERYVCRNCSLSCGCCATAICTFCKVGCHLAGGTLSILTADDQ
uniref:SIVA1 apoptosis inducing factor n=1 Tax=Leptobrachium leishanense TaxID=445787 RepID=A0A8C5WGV6_9ANUR